VKKRIGVVFGGRSVEHEVSVITGQQVMENIDKSMYDVVPIYINKEGKWLTGSELFNFDAFKKNEFKNLKEIIMTPFTNDHRLYVHPEKIGIFGKRVLDSVDVIFPTIHGTNGEDGTLQGFLELLNIPYVGGGVLASAVGMDKILMKHVFKAYGLPIKDYTWYFRKQWTDSKDNVINDVEKKLGYPVFVKPANLGSSVGISKAKNRDELIKSMEIAINYDRKVIVEQAVEKPREINCAVMGFDDNVKASLCEEPVGWEELLTYEDKYIKSNQKGGKGERRVIPANLSEEMRKEIEELAKSAFMAIDCKGNARIDFLIDKNNKVYVNEINTLPGSLAYYLWEKMGISFKDLVSEMIEIAIVTNREKNKNMYSYDVGLLKRVEFGKGVKNGGLKK
jgi:D-alanine-D-alanine ligase